MKCFCQSSTSVASCVPSEHYENTLWQESWYTSGKVIVNNHIHILRCWRFGIIIETDEAIWSNLQVNDILKNKWLVELHRTASLNTVENDKSYGMQWYILEPQKRLFFVILNEHLLPLFIMGSKELPKVDTWMHVQQRRSPWTILYITFLSLFIERTIFIR